MIKVKLNPALTKDELISSFVAYNYGKSILVFA